MRVLAVHPGPAFSVADVHAGWVEALRELGVDVADLNLGDRIEFYSRALVHDDNQPAPRIAFSAEEAVRMVGNSLHAVCYQYAPDVLLATSAFYLTAGHLDLIRARGCRVVIIHTESPYEDDQQVKRAAYADVNVVNDPTNLAAFRAQAVTHYLPHAYRPAVHHPRPGVAGLASDFCFVGTGYPSRVAFLEAVDWSGIKVSLAGNWQSLDPDSPLRKHLAHDVGDCCDNTDTADLYASTAMGANLYRREAAGPQYEAGWSMGPREVELAAMGVPFLRQPRGEGDEVLPMLPVFDGPGDFGEQLRWWLAHEDTRRTAAGKARMAVADRTFTANARQLLRLLDTTPPR